MDFFSYTVKSAYISNLKLVKDIEAELRDLQLKVVQSVYGPDPEGLDAITRPFMLYTQCLKLFQSNSTRVLPDFFYTTRHRGATVVLCYLVNYHDTPITYQEYLDIFKDLNTDLVLPHSKIEYKLGIMSGMESLVYLAKVIKDQPNPYPLLYTKVQPGELYTTLTHRNNNSRSLLQALAIRQNVLNDLTYTVLEDYINYYKKLVVNNPIVNTTATLEAEQLLNASKEFDLLVRSNAN